MIIFKGQNQKYKNDLTWSAKPH